MKRGARGDVWKIAGDFGKGNNTGNTGIDSTNWIPLFFLYHFRMFSVHVEIFILMPECTCWGFMYFYGI